MVRHILLILFITTSYLASSSTTQVELDQVYSLTKNNLDSAYTLSYELLKKYDSQDEYYGLVKLNYLLGYYQSREGNIGKSVLHYLEAIRYVDEADYDNVQKDAIDIRQNLANLYRKFKANDLAIKYYKEGIEIADWLDDRKKINSLKFNLALTYKQADYNEEAIALFKELLDVSSTKRRYRVINELGLIFKNTGDFENAKAYFLQLQNVEDKYLIYSAKALHNLGRMEYDSNNPEKAIDLISRSISIKEKISDVDERSLFISYKTLGEYLFSMGDLSATEIAYNSAEKLIDAVKDESLSFELYRSISQLKYETDNPEKARDYSNLYSKAVDDFLESQQDLQAIDRQYNMDLITKRYFDEVAKQERISNILFYSKMISGSLLFLLLLTVGYNWYQKVQLRKSIIQDLINLKVVD
ncbi:tetratricopeptide repeat protein [Ekhidna sp.]